MSVSYSSSTIASVPLFSDPKHICVPSMFLYSNGCADNASRAIDGFVCRVCTYDLQEGLYDRYGNVYDRLRLNNALLDMWFDMADRYREMGNITVEDANRVIDKLVETHSPALNDYRDDVTSANSCSPEKSRDDLFAESLPYDDAFWRLRRRVNRLPKLEDIYTDYVNDERKRYVEIIIRILPVLFKLDTSTKHSLLCERYLELEDLFTFNRIFGLKFTNRHNSNERDRWIKIPLSPNYSALYVNDTILDNLFFTADYYSRTGFIQSEMAVNIFLQTTSRLAQCLALSKVTIPRISQIASIKSCLFDQLIDVNNHPYDLDVNPSRLHNDCFTNLWRSIDLYEFAFNVKLIITMLNDIYCNDLCVRNLAIITFDRLANLTDVDRISLKLINRIFYKLCKSDFSLSYLIFPFSFYIDESSLIEGCSYLVVRLIDELCSENVKIEPSTFFRTLDTVNIITALRDFGCISYKLNGNEGNDRNVRFRRRDRCEDVKLNVEHPFVRDFKFLQQPILKRTVELLSNRRLNRYYEHSPALRTSSSVNVQTSSNLHQGFKIFIYNDPSRSNNFEYNVQSLPRTREYTLQMFQKRYDKARRIVFLVKNKICLEDSSKPWIGSFDHKSIVILRTKMELRNNDLLESKIYSRRILLKLWSKNGVCLNLVRSKEFVSLIESLILCCKYL